MVIVGIRLSLSVFSLMIIDTTKEYNDSHICSMIGLSRETGYNIVKMVKPKGS